MTKNTLNLVKDDDERLTLNLVKEIKPQIRGQQEPSSMNIKNTAQKHIIVKQKRTQDQKNPKSSQLEKDILLQ